MRFRLAALCAAGFLSAPLPARASFEDAASGAAGVALGEALTALPEGLDSAAFNPATLGQIQESQLEAGWRRAFLIPAGAAELDQIAAAAAAPVSLPGLGPGALGFAWSHAARGNLALDRLWALQWATRGWQELGCGSFDLCLALKGLSRSGRAFGGGATKVAVDLGGFWRLGEQRFAGVSLLNANGPRTDAGPLQDRAPATLKAGYAQAYRGFTMAVDATKREASLGLPSGESLGAGAQYARPVIGWGTLALRTGLSLADRSKSWGLGLGWRVLGARLDYALQAPLGSGSRWGNAVSLHMRFGSWDPERAYERLLGAELGYRRDLSRALDASRERQRALSAELERLRGEMEALRSQLESSREDAAQSRARLQALEERRRRAERALQEIGQQQGGIESRSRESLFREDWAAYQRAKQEGVPEPVLLERLKRVLREYQGSSVDLSEANQELLRLLRGRAE